MIAHYHKTLFITIVFQIFTAAKHSCFVKTDIDFICAKNADAFANYYEVNGLGIATSLWNLPFNDQMFTSVCSNTGLEECREIPTIISEAYRVLIPGGRIVLRCIDADKAQGRNLFQTYGFSTEEMISMLKKVRLYSNVENVEELLLSCGFKMIARETDKDLGYIIVYEK